MESSKDLYEIAYEAYEESCMMDDYLENIVPIYDA